MNMNRVLDRRQQPYETHCDGCGNDLPGKLHWSELNQRYMFGAMLVGPFVAVITDQSGSEQATTHKDEECIELAIDKLAQEYDHDDT